jgi:hypothetical protein
MYPLELIKQTDSICRLSFFSAQMAIRHKMKVESTLQVEFIQKDEVPVMVDGTEPCWEVL